MIEQAVAAEQQSRGTVRWFNITKGYGFVIPDEPGPDIMIHVHVIRQSRYLPGTNDRVICGFTETQTGRKATWLNRI